ncbi:hypothetical protein PR048_002114 [Dryococelus australis]|uniref:Uncharacterized protein n=1 Tax=Dryococelus australis TaxID=614101 RepID=A0ABQ9IKP3_9NEOP|nr:hypothetical protein PR048_002114 [Dryococelus australis]
MTAKGRTQEALKTPLKEVIAIDFSKNIPCPNIKTNDFYYKLQLLVYVFNLSTRLSYDETVAKKRNEEVSSFLHHFVTQFLDSAVKELAIFCYSCGDQNKNATIIPFLQHLIHKEKYASCPRTFIPSMKGILPSSKGGLSARFQRLGATKLNLQDVNPLHLLLSKWMWNYG